jgi:CelD/BcsL family acetyltransferase involved in cellulose biosynthesis
MAVLFVDGYAAASQIWFVANKHASIFKLAYDEKYKSLSVGSILTADLFKNIIENDDPIEVEYGVGDEAYKSDWMDKSRQRITLDIYNATTVRGKLLYIFKRIKHNFSRNM